MHMLSWLAVNGTAAIVEFPGVLYRGGAEKKIRKYLVDNNYVDAVIQLPPDPVISRDGFVGGAIVHDDALDLLQVLSLHALQQASEARRSVTCGNHDRDGRFLCHFVRRGTKQCSIYRMLVTEYRRTVGKIHVFAIALRCGHCWSAHVETFRSDTAATLTHSCN